MDCNNTYYKKIVYKKNAFEDLKTYVKLNYANRGICLVTTKSVPSEEVTSLLNGLFGASENVFHFVARNGFDERELDKLNKKISGGEFNLIVSFGGGKCCDVVKYFASKFDLPFIVCPSIASSLAYFSKLCINPYNANDSFCVKMPNKIFIQESVIKNASCYSNINGLCFLHSLRSVFLENIINDEDNEKYIYLGLEKLFNKLDQEQTNILLCNEDSNLVLMDLFIDFGFFIGLIERENYLINAYEIYESVNREKSEGFVGKKMLVISKTILSVLKKFLELNVLDVLEVPDYENISNFIEKYEIFNKKLKNNAYFTNFMEKAYVKKQLFENRHDIYKRVCFELLKINMFCKKVKNVYKKGIETEEDFENLTSSIAIAPYVYGENILIDFVAGSGILNSFVS